MASVGVDGYCSVNGDLCIGVTTVINSKIIDRRCIIVYVDIATQKIIVWDNLFNGGTSPNGNRYLLTVHTSIGICSYNSIGVGGINGNTFSHLSCTPNVVISSRGDERGSLSITELCLTTDGDNGQWLDGCINSVKIGATCDRISSNHRITSRIGCRNPANSLLRTFVCSIVGICPYIGCTFSIRSCRQFKIVSQTWKICRCFNSNVVAYSVDSRIFVGAATGSIRNNNGIRTSSKFLKGVV